MPVIRRIERVRDLDDLLYCQAGAATRQQLLSLGCTDSWIRARVASGRWQRPYRRVFVAAPGPLSYATRVSAAILHAGPGAHASHDSAAFLGGVLDAEPEAVHVIVATHHRVRPVAGLVVHRVRNIDRRPLVGAPPRSRNEDMVLDLVNQADSEDEVVALVTAALQRRKTSPRLLHRAVFERIRMRHRLLTCALLADDASGIHSVLEWRYFARVERAHGLPRARRQQAAIVGGKRVFRDVPYVEYGVVVELDGRLWHGASAFRDMGRDNATVERGEVSLRYGMAAVDGNPCGVARQVATVLRQRGWSGDLVRCGRGCTA